MRLRNFCRGLVVACAFSVLAQANPQFDAWAEAFAQEWIRAEPRVATRTQYLPAAEQDALDRRLALTWSDGLPVVAGDRAVYLERARRGLAEVERFPATTLTPVQRASAAFLRWKLRDTLRAAEFAEQRYVFDQFRGVHVDLVSFLTQIHPLRNRRDAENYLARLEQVGPLLRTAAKEAEARGRRGVLPPRFILASTLQAIERLLEGPAAKSVLVDTLAQALGKQADVPASDRATFLAQAEKLVTAEIRPAIEQIKKLLTEQRAKATDDAGTWRLPRGAEAYASALSTYTTTSLGAEEIHAIGLREVARIEKEMDVLLRQLGFNDGSVQSRYLQLQASLLPATNADPRPAIIAEITRVVRDAEKRAEPLFDLRPKAPIEVRREPAFTEAGAAARYSTPAPDGSRPGLYWIPLARLTPDVIWLGAGTKSVAYHEAVPGHHFQIALQQESTELPRFRKLGAFGFISAYSEGWALYAEQIADEAGWYEGDIRGRLGYFSLQLLRARRLVVDTGLHAKKWTRQQAIDYGVPASEVERYIVWPGQACSYMIGQLRILELREKARAALGPRFSLKEFHNVVLRTGAVPLDTLATVIDDWVAGRK